MNNDSFSDDVMIERLERPTLFPEVKQKLQEAVAEMGYTTRPSLLPVACVRPISRDRYEIIPAKGYRVIVFQSVGGASEACILDSDATEMTRLAIAPPKKNQTLTIVRVDDGIEVIYHAGL
jgi:hypothetical protein